MVHENFRNDSIFPFKFDYFYPRTICTVHSISVTVHARKTKSAHRFIFVFEFVKRSQIKKKKLFAGIFHFHPLHTDTTAPCFSMGSVLSLKIIVHSKGIASHT